jgi:hypothetical protein
MLLLAVVQLFFLGHGFAASLAGFVDTTWSVSGNAVLRPDDNVVATVIADDFGVIVAHTSQTFVSLVGRAIINASITKYTQNGDIVPAFGVRGTIPILFADDPFASFIPTAMSAFPGNQVLVAGCASVLSQQYYWAAAFDQTTGDFNTSFGGGGHMLVRSNGGSASCANGITLVQDGFILSGTGLSEEFATNNAMVVMRFFFNGTSNLGWGVDGFAWTNASSFLAEAICAFQISANQTVVIGTINRGSAKISAIVGVTLSSNGNVVLSIAKTRFAGVGPTVASSCVRTLFADVLVAGIGPNGHWGVAKLSASSGYREFEWTSIVNPPFVTATTSPFPLRAVVIPNNKLILVGAIEPYPFRVATARFFNFGNGTMDSSWSSTTYGFGDFPSVQSLIAQRTSDFIVGGAGYLPARHGRTIRVLNDELSVPCDIGPQCFCIDGNCMTQSDFIVPEGHHSILINGTATINGNLIGNLDGVIYISPAPVGTGFINVAGVTFASGTIVIAVGVSGTYSILNSQGGIVGEFGQVLVDQASLQPCQAADVTVMQSATSISAVVNVRNLNGCLTPAQIGGVAVGAIVAGIGIAVAIVLLARHGIRKRTVQRQEELRHIEMENQKVNLKPNAFYIV